MHFVNNFVKGIFIGAGAILPGISSGVLCIIFGLYEKLLDSILGFFKDVKGNLKFLFPILLGGVCGYVIFSNLLVVLFNTIPIQTKSLFMGLILGSIYTLYKSEINNFKANNISNYLSLFICFVIGLSLIFFENVFVIKDEYYINNFSFLFLILSGFFMSMGIIIPGVSSTVILMILGVYNIYISAVSIVNMNVILPMIIGVLIGSFIFMKIIQILFKKYHSQTMMGIIGFSLGSVFILYPGYYFDFVSIISIIILIFGFLIGKNIK